MTRNDTFAYDHTIHNYVAIEKEVIHDARVGKSRSRPSFISDKGAIHSLI